MRTSLRRPKPPPTSDGPRLRIRDPGDFVALVPYLLGFHPSESVVAIFLDRSRVGLTARLDLPPLTSVPAMAEELAGLAGRSRARAVVLLGYSESAHGAEVIEALAATNRLRLLDALVITPDRWRSILCSKACCPPEGTPYDLSSHPLSAEAVLAGMSAAPQRADLDAMLEGPSELEADRLEELAVAALSELRDLDRRRRQRRMRDLVEGYLRGPQPLSDADCAELAALTTDLAVRDIAWALITRARVEDHLRLWRRVVSRTVPALAAGPVGLLALCAWISGNGALLNCGINRLEEVDPGYSLLEICRDLSRRAVPPSLWDEMAPALRADPELLAGCEGLR